MKNRLEIRKCCPFVHFLSKNFFTPARNFSHLPATLCPLYIVWSRLLKMQFYGRKLKKFFFNFLKIGKCCSFIHFLPMNLCTLAQSFSHLPVAVWNFERNAGHLKTQVFFREKFKTCWELAWNGENVTFWWTIAPKIRLPKPQISSIYLP